jgi:hypothetical protein
LFIHLLSAQVLRVDPPSAAGSLDSADRGRVLGLAKVT